MRPRSPDLTPPPLSTPTALGYFITFRTYGTWLHGDARTSVDRKANQAGTPRLQRSPALLAYERSLMDQPPMLFDPRHRAICERAMKETCVHRRWHLWAVNIRTNHVHLVVTGSATPERIMRDLKSYATRALRQAGLISDDRKVWSRHGSTRLLRTPEGMRRACLYTVELQGTQLGWSSPHM